MPRHITPAVYNFDDIPGCVVRGKNRISTSIVAMYHAKQAGLDEAQGMWTVTCETHNITRSFKTALEARMTLSDPTDWCVACQQSARDKPKPRVRDYRQSAK